jgi:hypothetical protein
LIFLAHYPILSKISTVQRWAPALFLHFRAREAKTEQERAKQKRVREREAKKENKSKKANRERKKKCCEFTPFSSFAEPGSRAQIHSAGGKSKGLALE